MLIGHFSSKPMVAVKHGDTVLDPTDVNGNSLVVEAIDGHVAVGIPGRDTLTLEVMQAEELGFSILTLIETEADLSYTIQRSDKGNDPPRVTEEEEALVENILRPHIEDRPARIRTRDELIKVLRG